MTRLRIPSIVFLLITLFLAAPLISPSPALAKGKAQTAQAETATPTPTETPVPTDEPTEAPTATEAVPAAGPAERPLIVISNYSASEGDVVPGKAFTIDVKFANEGKTTATNIIASFGSGDFTPSGTGGVIAVMDLTPGDGTKVHQPVITNQDIWGKTVATLPLTVSYTDPNGNVYQENFTITFPIAWSKVVGVSSTATPTPTVSPTPALRPQLVITSYDTGTGPLSPGSQFALNLQIQNLGNAEARRVTMIIGGGGSSSGEGSESGGNSSAGQGGVSGGSGDLSNFAPLGSSNVQSLGDFPAGGQLNAQQQLIVNVSTNPGAYPLKISFTYTDERNTTFTDDQVITLLVFAPPHVELSFYRDPGPMFAGQPNILPLQVLNLGRRPVLLGNMSVSGEGGDFTNNVILVGNLEAGNYFTLDASLIPYQPGPLEFTVTVNYTDDFNQPGQITQTLTVDVMEAPPVEPGYEGGPGEPGVPVDGGPAPAGAETFWQKAWRFVRGLIGLDSGVASQNPAEGVPTPPVQEGPPPGKPLKEP